MNEPKHGWLPDIPDIRDLVYRPGTSYDGQHVGVLPDSVDLRSRLSPSVKSVHESEASIRVWLKFFAVNPKKSEIWPFLSDNLFCKAMKKGRHRKSTEVEYRRVPRTLSAMQSCLAEGFPIIFGFTEYGSFDESSVADDGVMEIPTAKDTITGTRLGVVVGYDDHTGRFTVQSNNGPGWADNGCFHVQYKFLLNPGISGDFWMVHRI